MNKTIRLITTMACFLTAMVANAYRIIELNSYPAGKGNVTAKYNSSDVEVGTTDIPASNSNNVTLRISPIVGYYVKKIEYELVTDLGEAESRETSNRASGPGVASIEPININNNYVEHFAGDYGLAMPASDIVVTVTFEECTSISTFSLTLDGDGASKVFDGYPHTLTLKDGATTLVRGQDYTISPETYSWTNVFSSTPTLTGIGKYKGTKTGVTLSITQKPLTITAQAQTITYGSSIQTGISKVDVTGLVTNDALTNITLTPSTSEVTDAGTITPSAATTTKGIGNYSVTYNTGLLIITPENLSAIDLSDEILDIELDNEYFNYNGLLQKAIVQSIRYKSTLLESGNSYTYDYAKLGEYTGTIGTGSEAEPQYPVDYITPDIYTIVISFCGNYTGTKRINYQIRPEVTLNNSTRWRTFYSPLYNMVVPESFTAYTVRNITSNAVILDNRTVIKAEIPMLLYRTGNASSAIYPPLIPKSDIRLGVGEWTNTYANYKYNATNWNLTSDDNIQDGTKNIMILVNDKFTRSKSGTLSAGKCYLDVSNSPFSSRDLNIDDVITGVHSIDNGQLIIDNFYYDLTGKRVSYPKKGIYILNGKKIIFK